MTGERSFRAVSGWLMLLVLLAAGAGCFVVIFTSVGVGEVRSLPQLVAGIVASSVWFVALFGFYTLQPNQSAVMLLFGKYLGTCRDEGFHWANPFLSKPKVSLRAHNLNGEKIKVNDKRGNPIEIAAVVVWRVHNTAQASFDVENYRDYVMVQSESALRHLATKYPYDTGEHDELSLRGSIEEVSADLQQELTERLAKAGVEVEEARLSHLAYAAEIAGAMLQRQQAEAIVAARRRIVDGAVGMVEMALAMLEQHKTVELDSERKANMVSNLLVVLCGDKSAHPVINAGTLY